MINFSAAQKCVPDDVLERTKRSGRVQNGAKIKEAKEQLESKWDNFKLEKIERWHKIKELKVIPNSRKRFRVISVIQKSNVSYPEDATVISA